MNQKNPQSLMYRAKAATTGLRNKMAAGAGVAFVGMGNAMAVVDTTTITATFDEYKVAVIALVIAFAVVLWAIKGAGLLKPR